MNLRRLTLTAAALALMSAPAIAAPTDCDYTWSRDGVDITSEMTCSDAEANLPEPNQLASAEPCEFVISSRSYLVGDAIAARTDAGASLGEIRTEISPEHTARVTVRVAQETTGATLTLRATGAAFVADSATAFITPAEDGEKAAVGIGHVEFDDDGALILPIAELPAGSSLSFEVELAGDKPGVNAELRGAMPECSTTPPPALTEYSPWADTERSCEKGTMLQERAATVREQIWNAEQARWEPGPATSSTVTRVRDLSAAEIVQCPVTEQKSVTDWRDIRHDCATGNVEQQRTHTTTRPKWDPVERTWAPGESHKSETRYRPMTSAEVAQCTLVPQRLTLADLLSWGS
ncbi:hypothetical protein BSZ39_08945 [Bowdeniella nasicola]|uniref:Ig-like domain-containing protein n=1 Tax=Bowdeniella nasicola TaxID=208480 RepID=A0A1Q5Q1H8_9ACTO|nr:hypothetical protein [Bowdeniella nasicola]OKL53555.1 hypothetical protein BSZ39_08945 [Bowdeniella nasicola]